MILTFYLLWFKAKCDQLAEQSDEHVMQSEVVRQSHTILDNYSYEMRRLRGWVK